MPVATPHMRTCTQWASTTTPALEVCHQRRRHCCCYQELGAHTAQAALRMPPPGAVGWGCRCACDRAGERVAQGAAGQGKAVRRNGIRPWHTTGAGMVVPWRVGMDMLGVVSRVNLAGGVPAAVQALLASLLLVPLLCMAWQLH